MAVLVDLERVSARTPDRTLFDDFSITISDGDRIGVVGINGTGKSTLLRIIAGVASPDSGQVRRGRNARVAYLDQEAELPPGQVRTAVGEGWEAKAVLDRLGMSREADSDIATLSGGQAKRVALAIALAQPSELLVLDEPTNHLDLAGVAWLERYLARYKGGLVIVSHDRHLLDRVTTRMIELDRGSRFIHDGGYASYLDARVERAERAAVADAVRRNLARHELAWLRRGAPARTRKPQARINKALELLSGQPEAAARSGELAMAIGTPRLGDKVIEVSDVTFSYASDTTPTLSSISLHLDPDDRLGIVGSNGVGKSTLLDLLAGNKEPASGTIEVGSTVAIGYWDQLGVELDPTARVQDLVAGPHRSPGSLQDVALMERFWFTGDLPFAPVHTLSGGERRRLQLLLVLARQPNVLFLDEPTNNLDLDTIRILEEFLDEWPGVAVIVSHDRTFLERTTERLLALDGSGAVHPVVGGLGAWIEQSEREATSGRGATKSDTLQKKPTSPGKGRSASTIYKELRDAEKDLTRLEKRRSELESEMHASADHAVLARIGAELAAVQSDLSVTEHRWLELSEEQEGRA